MTRSKGQDVIHEKVDLKVVLVTIKKTQLKIGGGLCVLLHGLGRYSIYKLYC
jgi:hypothetical protein